MSSALPSRLVNQTQLTLTRDTNNHSWHFQIQNDSKNLYSSEYANLKGTIAEDLRNRELTYPIVLGLDVPEGQWVVRALECPSARVNVHIFNLRTETFHSCYQKWYHASRATSSTRCLQVQDRQENRGRRDPQNS